MPIRFGLDGFGTGVFAALVLDLLLLLLGLWWWVGLLFYLLPFFGALEFRLYGFKECDESVSNAGLEQLRCQLKSDVSKAD
jgi:hypothetical protein